MAEVQRSTEAWYTRIMDIFPTGSTWYDPRHPEVFYRIESSDLLSVTLQIIGNSVGKITEPLGALIDMERIIESNDSEWYEAECNLFV